VYSFHTQYNIMTEFEWFKLCKLG